MDRQRTTTANTAAAAARNPRLRRLSARASSSATSRASPATRWSSSRASTAAAPAISNPPTPHHRPGPADQVRGVTMPSTAVCRVPAIRTVRVASDRVIANADPPTATISTGRPTIAPAGTRVSRAPTPSTTAAPKNTMGNAASWAVTPGSTTSARPSTYKMGSIAAATENPEAINPRTPTHARIPGRAAQSSARTLTSLIWLRPPAAASRTAPARANHTAPPSETGAPARTATTATRDGTAPATAVPVSRATAR